MKQVKFDECTYITHYRHQEKLISHHVAYTHMSNIEWSFSYSGCTILKHFTPLTEGNLQYGFTIFQ